MSDFTTSAAISSSLEIKIVQEIPAQNALVPVNELTLEKVVELYGKKSAFRKQIIGNNINIRMFENGLREVIS